MVQALDAGQITPLGLGVIAVLIILGVVISAVVTALVVRIVVLVAVVVLAVVVWQQRSAIEHRVSEHRCSFSFFGVHLDPPDHLKRVCD